jgi:hypothetical protein
MDRDFSEIEREREDRLADEAGEASSAAARSGVDIIITRDRELMVAQAEGVTDAGVEFVDAYNPGAEIVVVDAGRIILPDGVEGRNERSLFVGLARTAGLEVEES